MKVESPVTCREVCHFYRARRLNLGFKSNVFIPSNMSAEILVFGSMPRCLKKAVEGRSNCEISGI